MEDESEKKEVKKHLMRSSSGNKKAAAGFHFRSMRPGCRRRPFSTPTETAAVDSGSAHAAAQLLSRSCSSTASGDDVDGGVKNSKQGGAAPAPGRKKAAAGGVGARLSRKLKEERARFYIMRRCVAMLVCWRDDVDN